MNNNNKFQFINMEEVSDDSKEEKKKDVLSPDKSNDEIETKINTDIIKKFYFSFEARIIVSVIAILLLFGGACFLGYKVINHTSTEKVSYIENGDFTYQVCSNDSTCKIENLVYTTDSIDIIKILFKYDAKYEKKIDNDTNYRVTAIVNAFEKENHKLLYQKDINLVKKTKLSSDSINYSINKEVVVDYNKYKELVKEYKDTDKQVEVALYLEENGESRKISSLTIPFSTEEFTLNKYTTANTTRNVEIKVNSWDGYSVVYGIAASLLTLISLVLIYKTTRLVLKVTNNKSEYEEEVDSLLKEYDSIIIVARDGYESMIDREVIKLESFEELVKMREDTEKPIIFSKVNNVKCEFILEKDDILYKYVMKEADFTEDDKNKLENK